MLLPKSVLDVIDEHSKDTDVAGEIKNDIANIVDTLPLALSVTPVEEQGKTQGDWSLNFNGNEIRPDSAMSWTIIDDMEKSAMPAFAILMKLAPILSVFRSWNGILMQSPDEELAEVSSENMRQVLPLMAMEFGFRSMIDGVCFMETRYKNTTKFELGLAKNRLPYKLWTVAKQPHIVDPRTVTEIKRTKNGHKFDGFIQQDPLAPHKPIPVAAEQALVIPNNQRFRSLWGVSSLELLYRPWFWYQVFLRSIVRWGERMAVPTVIGKAPMLESIPDPNDPTTTIKSLDYMASVASSLARSSFATIPSDVDPETKVPKFALGYENASEGGVSAALVSILQEIGQMIIRAAISADRATTQSSGGVGSYSIGEIHNQASQNHNQMILTSWMSYLNKYFFPWLSYFNRGANGPPLRAEVAFVDPSYRSLLVGMLSTMGNTKPGQDALWSLDYDTLLSLAHVPTLEPEEAEAKRKKFEEEAMDRADEAMRRQQEMAPPPEAAEARRAQGRAGGSDIEKKANDAVKKVEAAADELTQILDAGGKTPIYVGVDQVAELVREIKKPIEVQVQVQAVLPEQITENEDDVGTEDKTDDPAEAEQ